ncbi:MAG: hypothetical protein ACXVXY_07795 [Mycobacteriaceae bacterium]
MVADYARIVIEHTGIRAFLGRDGAYAFQLLTVSSVVTLEDLAYTSARIIEVYAHAFELTGGMADGDRASRVLLALLR